MRKEKNNIELLKVGPMAREIGVPVRWLKSEADAGKIPCLKAENIYLFDPEIVMGLLAKRARGASNEQA